MKAELIVVVISNCSVDLFQQALSSILLVQVKEFTWLILSNGLQRNCLDLLRTVLQFLMHLRRSRQFL